MYFKNFKQTQFLVSPPGYNKTPQYVSVVDITTNIKFLKEVIDKITLYEFYDLKDTDTIDILAEKVYGSSYYNWIIMLLNDIYDYRKDFILNQEMFEKYIIKKYGSIEAARNSIHHYEDAEGNISTENYTDIETGSIVTNSMVSVSFYGYEHSLNDEKRKIKLISPSLLGIILNDFRKLINA